MLILSGLAITETSAVFEILLLYFIVTFPVAAAVPAVKIPSLSNVPMALSAVYVKEAGGVTG